jgi:predicted kinase
MQWVVQGNAAGFTEFGRECLDPAASRRVIHDTSRELERQSDLLERRRQSGFVRQCHGDLHLRNIVLLEGRPTLFDGVEFNDEISCSDVLYDLAFLLMDLWRRKLHRHANAAWNGYLAEALDFAGLPLLPLFLSCRASVRTKTSATAAGLQEDAKRRSELHELAREYLAIAERFLHPPAPSLVAVGGFSGSGKSTLARLLAPFVGAVPGAVILRSDEVRKRLCGVQPLERLGVEGYTRQVSERVYATLAERADLVLRGGHSVVVDAVFGQSGDRQALEQVAAARGVPFAGVWLDAPETVLIERTGQRRNDPSDADASVVRLQREKGAGPLTWCRIDAARPQAAVLASVLDQVRGRLNDAMNAAHPETR